MPTDPNSNIQEGASPADVCLIMMQQTRDILNKHRDSQEHFVYYFTIIEKIENNSNKNPDISIESSKSLMEGICKTILLRLDSSITDTKINNMNVQGIVQNACDCISKQVDLEAEFSRRVASLVQRMSEIRNERGDISHGKAAPKEYISDIETAKLIMYVTDSVLAYILRAYFSIDLSYKEEVLYEDNPEFNDFLDETYPLEGIIYSKALYEQDFASYEEQLTDYKDNLEEAEEE